MAVKVEVDLSDLRRLLSEPEAVLRDLDGPCLAVVRATMDASAGTVPRGGAPNDPLNLEDTGFTAGPVHNLGEPLSTTSFGGYNHPEAGAIHAGWHFGRKTRTAPDFLRRPFKSVKGRLRTLVAAQLERTLAALFPAK